MPIPNAAHLEDSITVQQPDPSTLELTDEEITEAKESLRRYFEIGWQIATRLQREGKLEEVLTKAGVNPTVKPPRVDGPKSDSSQTTI